MSKRYNEGIDTVRSLVYPFLAESAARKTIAIQNEQETIEDRASVTGSYDMRIPLIVSLELTSGCNLACTHCYASASPGRGEHLAESHAIATLQYLASNGTYSVLLTGGEPTMHPAFSHILSTASELMRLVRVATNLYSLPEPSLRAITDNDKVSVQTSIDGLSDTHNLIRGGNCAFEKTMHNVRLLAAAGKTVIVAMTANRLNWREVEQVVERCVDSGAAALRLGLTFPVGRAAFSGLALDPVEVETLQRDWEGIVSRYSSPTFSLNRSEEAQDYQEISVSNNDIPSCGAGHLIAHICANGDINPCPMLRVRLGNIVTSALDDAFSGPLYDGSY